MTVSAYPSGVLLEEETETWARFRIPCACHTPEHDLTLDLEYDTVVDMVSLRVFYPVCTRLYRSWWREWLHRFNLTYQLFYHGAIKCDGEFLFQGDKALSDVGMAFFYAYARLLRKEKERRQHSVQERVEYFENLTLTD